MFKTNSNAVGHYILGKSLGEGTFGKVKMGTHILTGEKVAVKVLEKSKIKDKKDVERISREIKILKQTHHPNVVQLYEIIETDKDLYLIMEFSSGGELFDIIVTNQKLKEEQACKYFQELVAAIDYIHSLGICHRDLKPENLLIDYDGTLKMVDFGLSNMYELPQGLLKTACGSPCYAAPEMIAGNQYYGLKSDLWSCGVVLYAMLCGYLPYEDQKTSNLYKKILSAEYAVPKFLSEEAKDLIAKIFNTNPDERIDVKGIREHPWFAIHQPECQSFGAARNLTAINQKIVNQLEQQLGFNKESLIKSIKNNKHNHLTATYYLLLKKLMMKQNRPYLHAFQQNAEVIAKFTRVRHKQTLRDKAQANNPETVDELETSVGKGLDQVSNFNLTAPTVDQLVLKNHRREKSQNPTSNVEVMQNRYQALAERKAESCERAPVEDDYEIILDNGAALKNKQHIVNNSHGSPDVTYLKNKLDEANAKQTVAHSLNQTQQDFSHLHRSSDGRRGRANNIHQENQAHKAAEPPIQIRNLNYSHIPNSGHNKQSTVANQHDDIIKITDEAVAQSSHDQNKANLEDIQYSRQGQNHRKANSFSESANGGALGGSGQKVKIKNFQQQENLKNLMNNIAQITKKVKERGHSNDPNIKQDTTINYSKLNQTFQISSSAQNKGKASSKTHNSNGSANQGAYPIFNMQLLSQGQSNMNDSRESTHKNSNSMFAGNSQQTRKDSTGISTKQSRVISTVNGLGSQINQSFDKANSSLVNGLQMSSLGMTQQQQFELSGSLGIKLTHAPNARTHSNQSPHIQNQQMMLSKTSQQSSRNQSRGADRSYQNYDVSRQLMGYNLSLNNGRANYQTSNTFSNASNHIHNTELSDSIGTGTSFENLQKQKKRGLSGPQQIPQLTNFGDTVQQQVFQMPRISNYLPPQNLSDSIVSRHSYAHPQVNNASYNTQSLNQSISLEKSKHRRASNNLSYTLNSGVQANLQPQNGRNHSHGFTYNSVNPNHGTGLNSSIQHQQMVSQNQTRPLKTPIQIQQDLNITDLYNQYQSNKNHRVRNSSQLNQKNQQNANIASNSFMNTGMNYFPPPQVNMNNSFHIAPANYNNQVNLNFSGPHYQTQSYNQNVSDQMKKTFYPRNNNTVSNAPALQTNANFQGVMNQINNSYLTQTSGSNQTASQSPEQTQKYSYPHVMRTTTTTSTTNPRASSTSYYTQGTQNVNVQSQPSNPLAQLQNPSQPHHQRNNSSGNTGGSNPQPNNINSSKLSYQGQHQPMPGGQPTVQNNIQNLIFSFPNNQQEAAMRL